MITGIFDIQSEEAMTELGRNIASSLSPSDIICLYGDLGVGKTFLTRSIIQSLCGEDVIVPSPTFTLAQPYSTPLGMLHHFDLYRIEDSEELMDIGWEDALNEGICMIEWPEKAGVYLPMNYTKITLKKSDKEKRQVIIESIS